MSVKYIHQSSRDLRGHVRIIDQLWNALQPILDLPQELSVVFKDLEPSVYADTCVNSTYTNRITLSALLQESNVPTVLVHEAIHLNQIHTGVLCCDRWNNLLWHGKIYRPRTLMTYSEYLEQPWEADVVARHTSLLRVALENILSKK